jgi:putative spermidine/putrescine transport system permease protein
MNATEGLGPEWRRSWLYLVSGLAAAFLIVPVLLIVPMSFTDGSLLKFPPDTWSLRWYRAFVGSERWMEAAANSTLAALGTMAIATPAGALAAWSVSTSNSKLAGLVWVLVLAPLVVPVILLAVGLYFVYGRLQVTGSLAGLILAHSMHALPYVFVTVHSALKTFDFDQPRVAQSLGASPLEAAWTITLPQLKLPLLCAAFLAFLSSFDEVVIALFISGPDHSTLTKLMFEELRLALDPTIAAVSSVMLGLALLVLVFTSALSAIDHARRARLATAQ